jgi:hypothetical protein
MANNEAREKIARELYEWDGRYGVFEGKLWKDQTPGMKDDYYKESQFLLDEILPHLSYRQIDPKKGVHIKLESVDGKPTVMFDDGDSFEQTTDITSLLMHIGILMPNCELPDEMVILPAQTIKEIKNE